jgi:hypothetical protein
MKKVLQRGTLLIGSFLDADDFPHLPDFAAFGIGRRMDYSSTCYFPDFR